MQRTTTAPEPKRVRIKAGVHGADGMLGVDQGPTFSGRYHNILLDGREKPSAFRPDEFTRVAS